MVWKYLLQMVHIYKYKTQKSYKRYMEKKVLQSIQKHLQCLIGLGSGIIKDFEMDSHRKSELSLVQRLEENKLILTIYIIVMVYFN